ncbi:hypothetical protein PMIN07_004139 [Paraphaeosphaeria minitans]
MYGKPLLNQIKPEHYHSPPRKTQLYPIRNDEKRQMAQGAICINHWVHSLPEHDKETDNSSDDSSSDHEYDTDTLQQLVIFWQCRFSHFQDEEKFAHEPILGQDPYQIEAAMEAATRTRTMSMSNTGFSRAGKGKNSATTQKNIEAWRESLRRSNMIVVFERSAVKHRNRRPIVIDELSTNMSSGSLLVNTTTMYTSNESIEDATGIHLIKEMIEGIFDCLNGEHKD